MEQVAVREHQVTAGTEHKPVALAASNSLGKQYLQVSLVVLPALAVITWIANRAPAAVARPAVILGPVMAMLGLTGIVFLLMLFARHGAILLGKAPIAFFRNFDGAEVPDWVNRPGRTFNNLMEVPTVFYVACAFMLQTALVDSVQVQLAWAFVAGRLAHAIVFVGWNAVKWRFAMAFIAFVAFGTMLYRFALQSAPLWAG